MRRTITWVKSPDADVWYGSVPEQDQKFIIVKDGERFWVQSSDHDIMPVGKGYKTLERARQAASAHSVMA